MKPRILFLQPSLQPPGGGNAVAVTALEALTRAFDVTLLLWERIDLDAIHRDYGVALNADDFSIAYVSRLLPAIINRSGIRGALLQRFVLLRHARRIARDFDAVVSFNNEIDVGDVCTIQYVHYPWGIQPRPEIELRAIHRVPGLLRAYYAAGRALAPVSRAQVAKNVTLVNSDWTGEQFRDWYGGRTTTLYPPLIGTRSVRPWRERENVAIALGTFAPHKRLERTIDLIERVRLQGHPLRLLLAGSTDRHHKAYGAQILTLAATYDWIDVHENPSREQVDALLARVRYGVHSMADEHFGMAVAEMCASGVIPFVPRGGGQVEVVGRHEALLYDSVEDGSAKMTRVLSDETLQQSLSDTVAEQSRRFDAGVFRASLLSLVHDALAQWLATHDSPGPTP